MNPEDLVKQMMNNVLSGGVDDEKALGENFRNEIWNDLKTNAAFEPFSERTLKTIIAWNRQTAAMFFEGNHLVLTYKQAGSSWQFAGTQVVEGVDIYDLEGSYAMAEQVNAQIKEPKLFIFE
jgi:hypothetical protein